MKKFFLSLLLFVSLSICVYSQQDPQYTQYMFNQLALNPAYAGSRDVFNVYSLLRNQWTGIDGAPKTLIFAAQAPLKSKKVGLGFQTFSETIGPQKVGGFLGSYAYRIKIKNGSLAMGLRYGFYNYRYNTIDYYDKGDPNAIQPQSQRFVQTSDFGLYYHTQTLYWGISLTHLIPQKLTSIASDSSITAPHLYITFGKAFQLSPNVIFNPSILLSGTQGSGSTDINLNFFLDQKIWLGMSLRQKYGLSFLAQYCFTEKLKFGYAFDWGLNQLGIRSGGSHEIMLQYDFNTLKTKTLSPRFL